MKKFLLLLNKNYFLNAVIFLLLTSVFLNYIHNSTDKYKKTNIKLETQETFVLIDKSEIKKEFSKNLILHHKSPQLFFDRECKITGNFHDRHKVRWVKALFFKSIFEFSYSLNEILPYYVNIFIYSIALFLTLIIINKTFYLDKKYNLIFLLYITFIFQQYLSEYEYSILETFFLSIALYASKNKKFFLFLLACLFAVLNRESGFIIIFSWILFNDNEFKKLFISFILIGLIFLFLNFDIIKCLLNPKFFVPLERQEGQVNISDLYHMNLISLIKILFTNFFLPFGIPFYYLASTNKKNKTLISLFLIYLITFTVAAPLHDMSVRLILIPLIATSIYFYNLENNFNNRKA